jgi:hypothetical protein
VSADDVLRAVPALVLLVAVVAKLAVGRRERAAAVRGLTPQLASRADAVATALLVAEAVTVALLLSPLSRLGGLATAGLGFAFAFVVGQRLTVSGGGRCGCMGRLSVLSIGPGLLGFDLALAAVGLAVAVDASLPESAVMTVAIVCAGLAAQAARVAIVARRRATS